MTRIKIALLAGMLGCAGAGAVETPAAAGPVAEATETAFRRVAAAISPVVVSIDTIFERADEHALMFVDPEDLFRRFGDEEEPRARRRPLPRLKGVGSGVIVNPKGYILTNEHVVGGAREIKVLVKSPEEKTFRGKVVGTDPMTDLAVIKIEAGHDLPFAKLGDSDAARVGDWAIAVGSPFGLGQTVTVGVISAQRQSFQLGERLFPDFLQTDAAINAGNSGGPLVDIGGQVIGINTAIVSPTGVFGGVGFAIPSNAAARVMKELIDKGRVVRGWAGLEIVPLNEALARHFKIPDGKGALVNRVLPGSPAEAASLRRGDVIVAVDGRSVPSPSALTEAVERTPPGKKVTLRVVRDGRTMDLALTAGERPATVSQRPSGRRDRAAPSSSWQGARLEPNDDQARRRFGVPDAPGAVVVEVEPDSAAEQMGLRPGDLIVSVQGRPVRGPAEVMKAAGGEDLEKGIVLDVNRRGRRLYLSYQAAR